MFMPNVSKTFGIPETPDYKDPSTKSTKPQNPITDKVDDLEKQIGKGEEEIPPSKQIESSRVTPATLHEIPKEVLDNIMQELDPQARTPFALADKVSNQHARDLKLNIGHLQKINRDFKELADIFQRSANLQRVPASEKEIYSEVYKQLKALVDESKVAQNDWDELIKILNPEMQKKICLILKSVPTQALQSLMIQLKPTDMSKTIIGLLELTFKHSSNNEVYHHFTETFDYLRFHVEHNELSERYFHEVDEELILAKLTSLQNTENWDDFTKLASPETQNEIYNILKGASYVSLVRVVSKYRGTFLNEIIQKAYNTSVANFLKKKAQIKFPDKNPHEQFVQDFGSWSVETRTSTFNQIDCIDPSSFFVIKELMVEYLKNFNSMPSNDPEMPSNDPEIYSKSIDNFIQIYSKLTYPDQKQLEDLVKTHTSGFKQEWLMRIIQFLINFKKTS